MVRIAVLGNGGPYTFAMPYRHVVFRYRYCVAFARGEIYWSGGRTKTRRYDNDTAPRHEKQGDTRRYDTTRRYNDLAQIQYPRDGDPIPIPYRHDPANVYGVDGERHRVSGASPTSDGGCRVATPAALDYTASLRFGHRVQLAVPRDTALYRVSFVHQAAEQNLRAT